MPKSLAQAIYLVKKIPCLQSLHSLTPAGLPPLPLGGHRVLHNLDLSNLGGKISQPYRAIEP